MTTGAPTAAWIPLLHRFSKWFAVERLSRDRVSELCAFFKSAYADQPVAEHFQDDECIANRWRWLNEGNPTSLDGEIPAWVCLQKDRIVGHFAVLAAVAVVQGKAIPVCWGRDLVIAPEVRRLGVGPLLVMSVVSTVQRPFFVAGISDEAYAIYRRLGFLDSGLIPLGLKVYQASRLLETLPWSTPRRSVLTGMVKAAQFLADRIRRKTLPLAVTPLKQFDERFDQWWSSIEGAFPCIIRRTSATMTWRYHHHPTHRYRAFAAMDGQALRGVVVVRHGRSRSMPAGFVSELLAHPQDQEAIDSLLGYAERFLTVSGEHQPAFIRCSVLHRAFEKGLARAGFLRAPSSTHLMGIHAQGSSELGGLARRENWFLSAGDSDLDML